MLCKKNETTQSCCFLRIYMTSLLVRLDFCFCQNSNCTSNINMYGDVLINIINSEVHG